MDGWKHLSVDFESLQQFPLKKMNSKQAASTESLSHCSDLNALIYSRINALAQ